MMLHFNDRFGKFLAFTSLLNFFGTSCAFQPRKNKVNSSTTKTGWDTPGFESQDILNIIPEAKVPFHESSIVDVDLDKARDFATHFGKYSYEEIEHMRDDLHAHRVQSLILGENDSEKDLLFLEQSLEDDLNSQLQALREDMPDPYLFRYPDKDTPVPVASESLVPPSELFGGVIGGNPDSPQVKNVSLDLNEKLLEDGVLESLAICAILGLLMTVPQQVF